MPLSNFGPNFKSELLSTNYGILPTANNNTINTGLLAWRGSEIVIDGLVLYLDAGKYDSYPQSGTTWTDLSGNGNNGTLTGGPTFDSGNGGSIVFDGTDDYVLISSAPVTAIPLTMCAWFKYGTIGGSAAPLVAIQRDDGNSNRCTLNINRTSQLTNAFAVGTSGSNQAQSTVITPTNTWSLVTGVFTSATSRTIYTNDAQDAVTNTTNVGTQGAFTKASSGARWLSPSFSAFLAANVAVALIYNRELSTTEITQNYNALKSRFGL